MDCHVGVHGVQAGHWSTQGHDRPLPPSLHRARCPAPVVSYLSRRWRRRATNALQKPQRLSHNTRRCACCAGPRGGLHEEVHPHRRLPTTLDWLCWLARRAGCVDLAAGWRSGCAGRPAPQSTPFSRHPSKRTRAPPQTCSSRPVQQGRAANSTACETCVVPREPATLLAPGRAPSVQCKPAAASCQRGATARAGTAPRGCGARSGLVAPARGARALTSLLAPQAHHSHADFHLRAVCPRPNTATQPSTCVLPVLSTRRLRRWGWKRAARRPPTCSQFLAAAAQTTLSPTRTQPWPPQAHTTRRCTSAPRPSPPCAPRACCSRWARRSSFPTTHTSTPPLSP
jgi:hypothetical protein